MNAVTEACIAFCLDNGKDGIKSFEAFDLGELVKDFFAVDFFDKCAQNYQKKYSGKKTAESIFLSYLNEKIVYTDKQIIVQLLDKNHGNKGEIKFKDHLFGGYNHNRTKAFDKLLEFVSRKDFKPYVLKQYEFELEKNPTKGNTPTPGNSNHSTGKLEENKNKSMESTRDFSTDIENSKMRDLEANLEKLQSKVEKLEQEKQTLTSDIYSLKTGNEILTEIKDEIAGENNALKKQLEAIQKGKELLELKVNKLTEEQNSEKVPLLNRDLESALQQLEELKRKEQQAQQQKSELEEQVKIFATQIQKHENNIAVLQQEKESLNQQISALQTLLKEEEFKHQKADAELEKLMVNHASIQNKLLDSEQTNVKLEYETRILRTSNADLQKELAVIKEENAKKTNSIMEEYKQQRVQIQQLQFENEQLQLEKKYELFKPLFGTLYDNFTFGIGSAEKWAMDTIEQGLCVNTRSGERGKRITGFKLLYQMDMVNQVNFHYYVDDRPNVLLGVRLANGQIIFGYSEPPFKKDTKTDFEYGFIMSVKNKRIFFLKREPISEKSNPKPITYDEYYLIFGNSEMRVRFGETLFYSNFSTNGGYFNNEDEKVDTLLCNGKSREAEMATFAVWQVCFE